MKIQKKHDRLIAMLKQIAPDGDLDSIDVDPGPLLESTKSGMPSVDVDLHVERAQRGMDSLRNGKTIEAQDQFGLEAIVLPKFRPAIEILDDNYSRPPSPWEHLGSGNAKKHIKAAIPSVGRIELPDHPSVPFGGTGFVVADGLLMTNRHVAEIFASGIGMQNLTFKPGSSAGVDFVQENKPRPSEVHEVNEVLMIHPYWDMALLSVEGIDAGKKALELSAVDPRDFGEDDVAVIGYPAQDRRNDLELQANVFGNRFDIKRLQPGKLQKHENIRSFGNQVPAITHDASTLGGCSGAAILHVKTGRVIALHFGGIYLKANYAVPIHELAKDPRVRKLDLNFVDDLPAATDPWADSWDGKESKTTFVLASSEQRRPVDSDQGSNNPVQGVPSGSFTWTIPLNVTVEVGSTSSPAVDSKFADHQVGITESLKTPIILPGLDSRIGYDPSFLDSQNPLPLPELTAKGKKVAANLGDGTFDLKYHKFSVVMHKLRRFAIYTAACVDWRESNRLIDGEKPTRNQLTGLRSGTSEKWVTDPRIPENHQLPDDFLQKDRKSFHKGHLVRRHDVCWGETFEDIQMANGDTFHMTNCSPQVSGFNMSSRGEFNWGDLENLIAKKTKTMKSVILSGPVFSEDDPEFEGFDSGNRRVNVQIPQKFWKIIVTQNFDAFQAFGFVLKQELSGVPFQIDEMTVPDKWRPFLVGIAEIEELLGGVLSLGFLEDFDQVDSDDFRELTRPLN